MNSEWIRWLLNLRVIPADAEGLYLAFERPFAPWLWALLIMAALGFALWSYSHMAGGRVWRGFLAGLRFVAIVIVLLIISGPVLELPRETVERDWVLVLADRSASMRIADVQPEEDGPRISREEQLRQALDEHAGIFGSLAEDRELVWLGFHVGAFSLSATDDAELRTQNSELQIDLGPADGARTAIASSIEQALQRAAGRPLSGIVVLSDGRTHDRPSGGLIRRLAADDVRVFTVPLGSSDPLADMAIRRVDSPRRAFIRDKVPVTVQIDRLGEGGRGLGAVVRLIDTLTGEELDREELAPGDEREEVTLLAEPDLAGEAIWRVEIETEHPALVPENTVHTFAIDLIDRPLRVLYVEGYPRWEYRYLKNLLIREKSIESSILLLSADRDFAQEGDIPITRLPRSPGEFAEYDVIVLGDVPGSYFTPEQIDLMRDQVAERGTGFLWIGGERNTPSSYEGTVLADLLPMRGSLTLGRIGAPVLMQPTPLAERLGVLQLTAGDPRNIRDRDIGWPAELRDPAYGWSQLLWAQRIDPARLKPTAEVIAETVLPVADLGAHLPLVTLMRYGAGRSMYVATDEIWRWRYGRGELLPEQFWVQMIRMLGRDSLGAGEPAVFDAGPRRVQVQQPVRLMLQVLDEQQADARRRSVAAVIENEAGEAIIEVELARQEGAEERYAATYLPDVPGNLRVRITEPALAGMNLQTPLEVFAPDDELRRPETDHELLANLSQATGGRMLEPDELSDLPDLLPNRAIVTVNPLRERIWDSPLFFALLLLVLTLEWIGRKVIRLI